MNILISEKDRIAAEKRAKWNAWIFRFLVAASLAVFILLCLNVRTINLRSMTVRMIVSVILSGWVCMGYYMVVLRPSREKARHLETLLSGEPAPFEGFFHMDSEPAKIPGSVWVRRVTLEGETNPDLLEGPERKRLNLDESLAKHAPAEGSRVRVQTFHGYITGIEVLERPAGEPVSEARSKKAFRARWILRRTGRLLPLYIVWAILATIIGGFVFSRIMEAKPKNKLVLYAECDVRKNAELADMLEKELTDPIRLVQVHSFDYAMFQESGINSADIYIVPASHAEEYREAFIPLPEGMMEDEERLLLDGVPYGIPFWVPDEGSRSAAEFFAYETGETYYLFFGRNSIHLAGNEDAVDNQAVDAAEYLMTLR